MDTTQAGQVEWAIKGEIEPVPGKGGADQVITNTNYWMGSDITVAKANTGRACAPMAGFGISMANPPRSARSTAKALVAEAPGHGPGGLIWP